MNGRMKRMKQREEEEADEERRVKIRYRRKP